MDNSNDSINLQNGVEIPVLGFGTFKMKEGSEVMEAVKEALKAGYRHIDTAAVYGNEEGVGRAIKESGIRREDIFLTSKVWNSDQGYDNTLKAFDTSLKKLDTDYLDLYLIHWPKSLNRETWRAMEKLYDDGRVKAIGVSNFKIHHLQEIMESGSITPMINQVELHPRFNQKELREFCSKYNIAVEAWGPLMHGQVFDIPLIRELAGKYGKSVSQLVLRWDIQMGVVTIPKSITPERIRENYEIFDFELSEDDMETLSSLDNGGRIGPDPDNINF
ncbi:MAG: aldo/keto reductase [Bacillota bacterium]|nr:aldo/keto reductase [Bacillota bacterium]